MRELADWRKWMLKAKLKSKGGQKGLTLIEVLIALAILAIAAVAFLTALTTGSGALIIADERTTAESLARTQLEYVKSQNYRLAANVTGEAIYNKTAVPQYYTIKGLNRTGYNNYPVIDYAYVNNNIIGVAWNTTTTPGHTSTTDTGIQIVTVIIYHKDKLILSTSTYKMNR